MLTLSKKRKHRSEKIHVETEEEIKNWMEI